MNCPQARLFITTDFLEQGNRHHTDALQLHLLTCATCRAFRDELAHIYKAYQHRDEIVPPGSFVHNLKRLYTKKKLPSAETSKQAPAWLKGAFALGLIVIFGGLFFWSQKPKSDLRKPRSVKAATQQTVSQNQVNVSPEATTPKPHDGGTSSHAVNPHDVNPHDEGNLTSGFNSVNYDEITNKLTTKEMSQDTIDAKEKHDDDTIAPIVLDDLKLSPKSGDMSGDSDDEDSLLGDNHEDLQDQQDNPNDDVKTDFDLTPDLVVKDAKFAKDSQKPEDILIQPAIENRVIEKRIVDKLLEKVLDIEDQDPPCALTQKEPELTSMEFSVPGYAEFILLQNRSIFLDVQESGATSVATEEGFLKHGGSSGRTLLNYQQVYYYLNARAPQTHGRLYSPRSLNRFLSQMKRSLGADFNETDQELSDWQNISAVLDELETQDTYENKLGNSMTEDQSPMTEQTLMTEDGSHALDVVDILSTDTDQFETGNQDLYNLDYCPVDPSKSQ